MEIRPKELAYVQLLTALIDASDYAGNLAEALDQTGGNEYEPGEMVRIARLTRMKALVVFTAAIHYELAAGRDWAQVAAGLSLDEAAARDIHGEDYARWCRDGALRLPDLPDQLTTAARPWPTDRDDLWAAITAWRRRRQTRPGQGVPSP